MRSESKRKSRSKLPVFGIADRYLYDFRRWMGMKYMKYFRDHYLRESGNQFENNKYRKQCLDNAVVYENAILQMVIENNTCDLERVKYSSFAKATEDEGNGKYKI